MQVCCYRCHRRNINQGTQKRRTAHCITESSDSVIKKKMAPENIRTHCERAGLTTDVVIGTLFVPRFCLGKTPICCVVVVPSAIFGQTCPIWSRHNQPCQSFGQSLSYSLKCVLSQSSSEDIRRSYVGFWCVSSMHLS